MGCDCTTPELSNREIGVDLMGRIVDFFCCRCKKLAKQVPLDEVGVDVKVWLGSQLATLPDSFTLAEGG